MCRGLYRAMLIRSGRQAGLVPMGDKGIIEQHALPAAVAEPRPLGVPLEPIEYPDSDGHFLPPHPLQANAIVELRFSLEQHFRGAPDVVLEGNMFMYYAQGEADERRVHGRRVGKYVAPDVFVVLGHDLGKRSTYKLWEEGKPPDFALEVISPSSELRNRREKKALYQRIGVQEYFLFQPDVERAGPRLVGYTLRGGAYQELGPDPALLGADSVLSEVLGVSLRPEGAFLRVRDQRSGKDYLNVVETQYELEAKDAAIVKSEQRAERAEQRAERETAARRSLEARLAALEVRQGSVVPRPQDED